MTTKLRVLSGIQPSGQLHLGNYAGAIRQFLDLQSSAEMYIFVASFHALTTSRDPVALKARIRQVVDRLPRLRPRSRDAPTSTSSTTSPR